MALFKHRGGSLAIPGTNIVLHYGPGLHKDCKDCSARKHELCITASGKPLKKSHRSRL
jgi:hypothetical protein